MAALEREVIPQAAQSPSLRLTSAQMTTLQHAAVAEGQTLDEFMVSALLRAADAVLTAPPLVNPLDKVIGIFKDEPLMEDLMNRIRRDRQEQIDALDAEIEAEEKAQSAE